MDFDKRSVVATLVRPPVVCLGCQAVASQETIIP